MRVFWVMLGLVVLMGCGGGSADERESAADVVAEPTEAQEAEAAVSNDTITILAYGDSLTEGFGVPEAESYPSQLERRLLADGYNVRVINGGVSGETTSGAVSRLDFTLQNLQPDIVIVETGGNDALRATDLDVTRENMDEIVGRFTESGAEVIVTGMQIVQNLGQGYADEFAAIYPAVAEQYDATLIPFFLEDWAADPSLAQDDFIHPTGEGYTMLVDYMYPYITEVVERVQASVP